MIWYRSSVVMSIVCISSLMQFASLVIEIFLGNDAEVVILQVPNKDCP